MADNLSDADGNVLGKRAPYADSETFADVLAGRKTVGTIKGTVIFAGHKPSRSFLRRYTGYVEQFGDTLSLLPSLTLCRLS